MRLKASPVVGALRYQHGDSVQRQEPPDTTTAPHAAICAQAAGPRTPPAPQLRPPPRRDRRARGRGVCSLPT